MSSKNDYLRSVIRRIIAESEEQSSEDTGTFDASDPFSFLVPGPEGKLVVKKVTDWSKFDKLKFDPEKVRQLKMLKVSSDSNQFISYNSGFNPSSGFRITSSFGPRSRKGNPEQHLGVDISSEEGKPVVSIMSGRIVAYDPDGKSGCGITVTIEHDDRSRARYCHLQQTIKISGLNQAISMGDPIGLVGHTGDTEGNHLHFEYTAPRASSPSNPAAANLPNAVFPLIPR